MAKTSPRFWGLFFLLGGLPLVGPWAVSITLPYKAQNQWVAPEDNAPLRTLYQAAQKGQTTFTVILPRSGRTLSEQRLGVLIGLLEKQANQPVTLTEATGKTEPNTLKLGW